ncbi:MAG: M56 family metallopeptidase [Actinomycetota bacterium]|nr:M56 family metallopeptidase [Actinomycetota bacterium]
MIVALALLGYAALLLTAGAAGLARARWADRAPRLAVAAWLGLAGSAVTSVILGGLALVVPTVRVSADLSVLLTACVMALRATYAHPGGAALAGAGAVLGLAVIARVTWCTAGTLARAGLARRRHRRALALAGRRDERYGVVLLDHDEAAAWCLPGAGQQVVLTTAAVEALDEAQMAAVLAHERAHQRGHHHLLVSLAGSLAVAFPRVRAFRQGHEQVARLVELLADDAAAAVSPRLKVAEALLALAAPAPAAAALGAGGSAAGARVRRLIAAPAPIGRARAVAGMLAVAALAALPLVVLAGPAAAVSGRDYCPQILAAAAPPGSCGTGSACGPAAHDGLSAYPCQALQDH